MEKGIISKFRLRSRREGDFIRQRGNAATFLLDQGKGERGEGRQTRLGLAGAGGLAEESNVFIVRLAESDGGDETVRVGRSGCRARVGRRLVVPRQLRGLAASCGELASLRASLFLQDLLRMRTVVICLWPLWSTIFIGWFVVIDLFLAGLLVQGLV